MRINTNLKKRHLKRISLKKKSNHLGTFFFLNAKNKMFYCPLLRFFKALARTPLKTFIISLFERNSGKSD